MINSFICSAGKISISYVNGEVLSAKKVKLIFTKRYMIPEELILLRNSNICQVTDERFIEVCIKSHGKLYIIPNENMELIKSSFTVFYKGIRNAI
jgi:hypothetical protein